MNTGDIFRRAMLRHVCIFLGVSLPCTGLPSQQTPQKAFPKNLPSLLPDHPRAISSPTALYDFFLACLPWVLLSFCRVNRDQDSNPGPPVQEARKAVFWCQCEEFISPRHVLVGTFPAYVIVSTYPHAYILSLSLSRYIHIVEGWMAYVYFLPTTLIQDRAPRTQGWRHAGWRW